MLFSWFFRATSHEANLAKVLSLRAYLHKDEIVGQIRTVARKIRDLSDKDTEEIQRQREKSSGDLEAFFGKQQ